MYIIGTIIIVSGFIWMFSMVIADFFYDQLYLAFFFTISGLLFWSIGNSMSEKKEKVEITDHKTEATSNA
jgi:hypothetical protein